MESRSALNLVIRISRLAGVAPITNSPSGLRVSRPLMFYSYLLVTAINCVVLSGFALDLLTEPARSLRVRTPTSRVIWVGNLSIIILIASVAVYTSPTRMSSVIHCLKEIEKIKAFLGAKNKFNSGEKFKFLAVITTCVGLWILIFFDLCGYALEALHRGTEGIELMTCKAKAKWKLSSASHITALGMDKTKRLVCSMMRHATTADPMIVELDLFTKQLILDRPTCSPLGLCTLSRPLTVTIIGAVTTYLVIIFQFRSNESGYK
ncbi:unnamed protein product, partial [Brenthis ino]